MNYLGNIDKLHWLYWFSKRQKTKVFIYPYSDLDLKNANTDSPIPPSQRGPYYKCELERGPDLFLENTPLSAFPLTWLLGWGREDKCQPFQKIHWEGARGQDRGTWNAVFCLRGLSGLTAKGKRSFARGKLFKTIFGTLRLAWWYVVVGPEWFL